VPLDYQDPDGAKVDLFVARMGSDKPDAPQVYLLEGGPGGASAGLIPFAQHLLARRSGLQVMLIDHRGVGRSTPFECSKADALQSDPQTQAAACVAEIEGSLGDVFEHFTTSNAARDVAVAVAALRRPEQKVFVYGVSYGTLWAHRFLRLTPTPVDAVVLDSALPPDEPFIDRLNDHYDPALARIADVCTTSSTCMARLGPRPFDRMAAIIGGMDASTCGMLLGLDRDALVETISLMQLAMPTAELIPSFLARLERCSPGDQTAATALLQALFPDAPPEADDVEDTFSEALQRNIVFGEMWSEPPPSVVDLEREFRQHVVASRFVVERAQAREVWPAYAHDEYVGKWAETAVPVLTLNGDLDVQTPIEGARRFASSLVGPNKYFVPIPWANHGVLENSATQDGGQCGLDVIVSFLDDPRSRPDTSCTARTIAPNLDSDPNTLKAFYGTSSAWGDTPGAPVPAPRAFHARPTLRAPLLSIGVVRGA
jgi:pimeloyl-ACP methyl ester carboxylesterase